MNFSACRLGFVGVMLTIGLEVGRREREAGNGRCTGTDGESACGISDFGAGDISLLQRHREGQRILLQAAGEETEPGLGLGEDFPGHGNIFCRVISRCTERFGLRHRSR